MLGSEYGSASRSRGMLGIKIEIPLPWVDLGTWQIEIPGASMRSAPGRTRSVVRRCGLGADSSDMELSRAGTLIAGEKRDSNLS